MITFSAWAKRSTSSFKPANVCQSSGSAIAADLMISAMPSCTRLRGKLFSKSGSIITPTGWVNVPTRFLALLVFTAVFPPILESTCANNVVGICKKSMPRIYVEATKPARSPITPPPRAMIPSLLVIPD